MAAEIVGYFLWRLNKRGKPTPSKLLKDHRDCVMSTPNKHRKEEYQYGLLKETPLTKEQWEKLTLDECVACFPLPDGYV